MFLKAGNIWEGVERDTAPRCHNSFDDNKAPRDLIPQMQGQGGSSVFFFVFFFFFFFFCGFRCGVRLCFVILVRYRNRR